MYIAYAADGSAAAGNGWMTWVMIAVIFAALYFFTIRPQNKRDKELKNFRNNLKPGDEIVTIGGIYGRVVRIMEDRVVIVVGSEKTKLEMAKSAINSYASPSNTAASTGTTKAKETEEPEKESKPSPKSIKKLGAVKKEAEEAEKTVAEALDEASEKTE